MDANLRRILGFLERIELPVELCTIEAPTFLPGIDIRDGRLLADPEKLLYPGDLLHEAGHLAVTPEAERHRMGGNAGDDAGSEMAAIAWSYAAALAAEIPIEVLFHPDGYKGGSQTLAENFGAGRYFGSPLLQWMGMTGPNEFPVMRKWLRS